jgi:cation diffusion facilitator family transporter
VRGLPERPDAERHVRAGQRLAWISIVYLASTVVLLFMVMGGSQALKTELVEDALSFIPPVLFLVSDRISRKKPNREYPFGFERAVSVGYVGSAAALLAVGIIMLFDGALKLALLEHPSIGGFAIGGKTVWMGWLAIPVLLWCAVPAHFLGRAKARAAKPLHDKNLAANAEMDKANWQSAGAAMLGMVGVSFGLWWADSLAGVLISLEIIRSAWMEVRMSLGDVMDRRPMTVDEQEDDPISDRIDELFRKEPWVRDVVVRVRERGREMTADAHVVPVDNHVSVSDLSSTGERACKLDPRLAEVTIAPVSEIPEDVARARRSEQA